MDIASNIKWIGRRGIRMNVRGESYHGFVEWDVTASRKLYLYPHSIIKEIQDDSGMTEIAVSDSEQIVVANCLREALMSAGHHVELVLE